jgi:acetyltransferase
MAAHAIESAMREDDRVIQPPLNEIEWDLIRTFVRRMERNDLRLRFGRSIDLEDDATLRRVFDIQAGRSDLTWTPDVDGTAAGLLHYAWVTPIEAEIALMVRSDLQGRGIGEAMLRSAMARSAHRGLKMLSGQILWENKAMLRLAKKVGFVPRRLSSVVVDVELQFNPKLEP